MRTIAAVFTLALHGCSFLFVSGPPANHQQLPAFDCTTSKVAPVLDTIWTLLQTANLVLAAGQNDDQWHNDYCSAGDLSCKPPISRGAAIPLYAVAAALGGAGMYYGYTRVGECRAARSALAARSMGQPGVGTWPPPSPGPGPAPAPVPAAPPEPPPATPTPSTPPSP